MLAAPFDLTPVFAHQYGWDEVAMFLVPVGLAIAGVRYAEKRAAERKRLAAEEEGESQDGATPEAEQPTP